MKHPYKGKPDNQFWKRASGQADFLTFDPVTSTSFKINTNEPVVTAGSCFAQNVSRHLMSSGYNALVTEKAHPAIHKGLHSEFNYGTFTARYGNIYTARQLKQLLQRAYGEFIPTETHWLDKNKNVIDPFRPQIQKNGFCSVEELNIDRETHFKAIRDAIQSLSVFVFTLGLTEAWAHNEDGAVYPLAPGIAGGKYDKRKYEYKNFSVEETADDLRWALNFIRKINPKAKFIITVSPVPLNATAENKHVWVATTYSKSVLRVVAEMVCNEFDKTDYFPSYEIITSPLVKGLYYGPDSRSITEQGVDHVMSVFFKHYGKEGLSRFNPFKKKESMASEVDTATQEHLEQMNEVVEVLCDEESIDNQ